MKMLVGPKQLQLFLKRQGFYHGQIDGLFGGKSQDAVERYVTANLGHMPEWDMSRKIVATTQMMFQYLGIETGQIDGLDGPATEYALEQFQNMMRDTSASKEERAQTKTIWPTYSQMQQFYGPVGTNIERVAIPYTMRLAWDLDEKVNHISLHKKCAESALNVLEKTLNYYGRSEIERLRLDRFGGSLNVRKMRGGNNWSTHSWAAAIDIDPANNAFRWNNKRASLDEADYDMWWEFWEAEGWVSLGRERNLDWMHVQAVRL